MSKAVPAAARAAGTSAPATRWRVLERHDAAVADTTGQPAHQRGGLAGKEQHAPADDSIKVAVQLCRGRITDNE
jgi:hypothetical protein